MKRAVGVSTAGSPRLYPNNREQEHHLSPLLITRLLEKIIVGIYEGSRSVVAGLSDRESAVSGEVV
jgi:hypothetical protein